MIHRVRSLRFPSRVERTGDLLPPAGLNNQAAALLSRIRWRLTRSRRVPEGTILTFTGRVSCRCIYEVDKEGT